MEFIYILQRSERLCESTINFVNRVGRSMVTEHSLAVKDGIPHCMWCSICYISEPTFSSCCT